MSWQLGLALETPDTLSLGIVLRIDGTASLNLGIALSDRRLVRVLLFGFVQSAKIKRKVIK